MPCPFIRETRVRSCRGAGIRKAIPHLPAAALDRCSSPHWRDCSVCDEDSRSTVDLTCPMLEESLVQFCAAAPVVKFIPYSEPLLSRCGTDAHRYCELFLDVMRAARPEPSLDQNLDFPQELLYTPNHWWLDTGGDGPCHIGLDSFLARLLGPVERIGFATPHGLTRPAVVLTARGVDFVSTFPATVSVEAANLHLRSDPSRVASDPYSLGWIFEGRLSLSEDPRDIASDHTFIDANAASAHAEAQSCRINEILHSRHTLAGSALLADGGLFQPGLLAALDREDALLLFNEFCATLPAPKRSL